MATTSATFPSLFPRVADDLWFTLEKKLDDDAALTKEEEEYAASVGFYLFTSCSNLVLYRAFTHAQNTIIFRLCLYAYS